MQKAKIPSCQNLQRLLVDLLRSPLHQGVFESAGYYWLLRNYHLFDFFFLLKETFLSNELRRDKSSMC